MMILIALLPRCLIAVLDIVKSIFLNQETKLVSDDVLYVGLVNMAFATRDLSVYGLPYSK